MTIFLVLFTLIAECLAIYGQLNGLWASWLWFWVIHGVASLSFSGACLVILPEIYRKPVWQTVLFVAAIAFAMPVVGMLGLVLLYVALIILPPPARLLSWRRADAIELPNETMDVSASAFGVAGLKDILMYHPDSSRRLDAVKACRYIPSREALPLFRLAMTDNEDDVRLLAFSFIDRMESELTDKINNLKTSLAKRQTPDMLLQLGDIYWEFYYLGLSEGAISRNYLQAARENYQKAAEMDPGGQVFIKLGRVYLAQHELDQASDSFKQSLAYSAPLSQAAFYLAEISFEKRDYQHIEQLLCASGSVSQGEYLDGLKEYWCESA